MDLFIDAEWFINQQMFVLGYGYNIGSVNQLYHSKLTRENVKRLFKPVTGYVYFYGPDVGMVEKCFDLEIRENYKCINLLKLFRQFMPGLKSYKLSEIEKIYGLQRAPESIEYKANIFKLMSDWNNPRLQKLILQYNFEDVANLIRLKRILFDDHAIKKGYLNDNTLQGLSGLIDGDDYEEM